MSLTSARRRQLMRECGIDPAKLYLGAHDLGSSITDDPTLTADDVSPAEFACLSVADRLELQERSKRAKANPSGLKQPPPKPPRKLGTNPDGTRFDLPDLPPPPPPPHLLQFRTALRSVDELSASEVQREIRSIATEWDHLERKLAALPEEVEGEAREIQEQREQIGRRMGFLSERAFQLEERRRAELYAHVEATAAERQLAADGGPRLRWPAAWHSGRMI